MVLYDISILNISDAMKHSTIVNRPSARSKINVNHLSLFYRWMNILFEVADLDRASPGTVGRCGIIYMESASLGWRPYKQSFLELLPTSVFAADLVIEIF